MTDQLPYPDLPQSKRGKIRYLARVLRVEPIHLKDVPEDKAIRALVGVVLFRHVKKARQREIKKVIHSLPGPARMRLDMRVTDSLVNRSWGVWSLSTEELKEREKFLEWINKIGSFAGLTFSGQSIYEVSRKMLSPKSFATKGNAVLAVALGGFFVATSNAESRMEDEIGRRSESF